MAYLMIRDDALWARHIEGDPRAVERILALPQNGRRIGALGSRDEAGAGALLARIMPPGSAGGEGGRLA